MFLRLLTCMRTIDNKKNIFLSLFLWVRKQCVIEKTIHWISASFNYSEMRPTLSCLECLTAFPLHWNRLQTMRSLIKSNIFFREKPGKIFILGRLQMILRFLKRFFIDWRKSQSLAMSQIFRIFVRKSQERMKKPTEKPEEDLWFTYVEKAENFFTKQSWIGRKEEGEESRKERTR